MIPVTLAELAEATGGTLLDADPGEKAAGLTLDSRNVAPGDLFVGLPGERADGAAFAAGAVAAGAVAAVIRAGAATSAFPRIEVADPLAAPSRPGVAAFPRIEVADPLAALTAIGGAVRDRSPAKVIGVTGSSGKTLTKDLLAAVFATKRRTLASAKSFNNEIGLPLTLTRLEPDTEVLVVEMGSRGVGHIAELCRTARPDVGVVTNVGLAHYEMFGSQATIAQAKGELPEALPADGVAVLNADDALVAGMAERTGARVVTYGIDAPADVRADGLTLGADARPSFTLVTPDGRADVTLPAPGEHLVADALAAAAAGWALGLAADDIAAGLAAAKLSPMRMEVTRRADGATIWNDAYNANPASMTAGLKALIAARQPGGRTIAILGEMAELGGIATEEHDRIGRLLVRLGIDRVVGVGPLGEVIVRAARLEGIWEPADAAAVPAVEDAAAAAGPLGPHDVVLVKASRAVGLDRAVEDLLSGQEVGA